MWEPRQDLVNRDKPTLPYRVRINSLGFRGPETVLDPSRPRVLFLGDSFTFGDFVDDEQTLPAQVQARLGSDVEVLNGGVGGTTIVDQRVFLEKALTVDPDVVVIVFFENDLNGLLVDPPQHEQLERNRAVKSGPLSPLFRLVRNTAVFHAFLEIRARIARANAPTVSLVRRKHPDETPEWVTEMAERYAGEAAAIRQRLEAKGIELIIAGFPHPGTTAADPDSPPNRVEPATAALADRGLALFDLTPALVASRRPITELYLLPEDGHASPLAYALAAEALAPEIERVIRRRSEPELN
jgi:lysophospholipase L1-like esterase